MRPHPFSSSSFFFSFLLLVVVTGWVAACGGRGEEEGCADFPGEATAPTGTLGGINDCGHWSLAVGAHVYLNVEVTAPDMDCSGTTSGAVFLPYDPIYSNLSDDAAKWTFDIEGGEAGEGTLDVTCEEGTRWSGIFTVSP